MMNLNKALLIFAALGAIGALSGCGSSGGGAGATALSVNGENITKDQLMTYLSKKPTVRVSTQSGVVEAQVSEPLDFQALQDMIGQRVIMQLAKDEGVYPDSNAVAKELEFRKKMNPLYIKELTANGIDMATIKDNLALELARENLLTKGITVTAQEAEDYIKKNPNQFTEPASVDMLWVFVKTKSRQAAVDNEIASGQSFGSIAVRYSEFQGAQESGGRFPQRKIADLTPQLRKIVEAAAAGKVTDWLSLSDGYAKFFIEKKTPAKPMVLDADKKELVRRSIARGRGEQATDLPKRVLDKIKQSDIKVNDPTLAEGWKKAFEKLKKEGQAVTGQNPQPAPGTTPPSGGQ